MKSYLVRVNTIDNLYADYIVNAKNLIAAKLKVKKAFFRNYPNADRHIKLLLGNPDYKIITKIMNIIKEGN